MVVVPDELVVADVVGGAEKPPSPVILVAVLSVEVAD